MKVKLESLHNEITIMHLEGFLNFETSLLFEKDYLSAIHSQRIIFNFLKLKFVGSCGLVAFVQTLNKFFQSYRPRPRITSASNEFIKLMVANHFESEDFYKSINSAIKSYHYNIHNQQRRLGPSIF